MPYITLPDGGSYPILDGETPEQAWAEAQEKYPQRFVVPHNAQPNATQNNYQSTTGTPDQLSPLVDSSITLHAFAQSAFLVIPFLAVYFLIAPKSKSKNPSELGRRWFAAVASIGIFIAIDNALRRHEPIAASVVILLSFTFFSLIAFHAGRLYGKHIRFADKDNQNDSKNHPSTLANDNSIYAKIADELEKNTYDTGLWTRLFAQCNGDEKQTKVLYIKQRAKDLITSDGLCQRYVASEQSAREVSVEKSQPIETDNLDKENPTQTSTDPSFAFFVCIVFIFVLLILLNQA